MKSNNRAYFSEVKVWFTFNVSAIAAVPSSPISLKSKLKIVVILKKSITLTSMTSKHDSLAMLLRLL